MAQSGRGVKICFGDVHASWLQIIFCSVLLMVLTLTTVDLLTSCYSLHVTERFLFDAFGLLQLRRSLIPWQTWLDGEDMAVFLVIFVIFGSISIVMLLPQTVLFLAAGYACAFRISSNGAAFMVGLLLSMVTFVIGASIAFLLSRSVLPPSCTRKFFKHFAILEGLDHALRHRGRRINILLRVNPLAPYNALNYGLGLSSCSYRAYIEGMVGAVPYTCIAVYAGMVIGSVDEIDSLFSHTTAGWYCVYAVLGIFCFISFAALIRYTAAEMKAAAATTPAHVPVGAPGGGGNGNGSSREGAAEEGQGEFGGLPPDSTLFGTFTSHDGARGVDGGEGEEMKTLDGAAVDRLPLLGGDPRRHDVGVEGKRRNQGGRLSSLVDI